MLTDLTSWLSKLNICILQNHSQTLYANMKHGSQDIGDNSMWLQKFMIVSGNKLDLVTFQTNKYNFINFM